MKITILPIYTPTKENNYSIIHQDITHSSGIYFLFDNAMELIYIGKAKDIRNRILTHVTPNNNSRKDNSSFIININRPTTTKIPFGEVRYYSYIEIFDEDDRTLKESILISIFRPKYNLNIKPFVEEAQEGIKNM